MARVLVTGMSGTGKSTVLATLSDRGIRTVDTDYGGWSEEVADPSGMGVMQVWREDRMAELLNDDDADPIVVSGTVSNQGVFYGSFDAVVLLSAPLAVVLERVRLRTSNPFGREPDDIARIRADLEQVEPLLRAGCTVEIDATRPIDDIAEEIEAIVRVPGAPSPTRTP